jgi:hypothetical protein
MIEDQMRAARFVAWILFPASAFAQTTQGIIAGHVTQLATGQGISGAVISWTNTSTNARGAQRSSRGGLYSLAPLSPGVYLLRVEADGYQPRELHEVEVTVAGRLDIDFAPRALSETMKSISNRAVSLPGEPVSSHDLWS